MVPSPVYRNHRQPGRSGHPPAPPIRLDGWSETSEYGASSNLERDWGVGAR